MEENRHIEEKPTLRLSRRTFLKAAAGASGLVLLTACTSTPAPSPTAAGAAQPAATKPAAAAQPTAAAAPAKAQKPVVIVQGAEVSTLDPHFFEGGNLSNITTHMMESLCSYDRKMSIVPDLAESWTLQADKLTWQFKLKKGIKYWNGEDFNAKAVKFTFDRIGNADLRKQSLNDPYYARTNFDRCDVLDDYTVNIVTKVPNPQVPLFTTLERILAPDYYSKHTPQETAIAPMGTGPYIFKEWVKDDHVTLTANPNYWQGKPPIDTLIFKPVPEVSTRLSMLQAGEADVVADLAPSDVPRVEADKNLRFSKAGGGRRIFVGLPTHLPLFSDRRVRRAFNLAVDMDAINKGILNGVAKGRLTVPVLGDFWTDPSIKPFPYDPAQATQLLKDAGWKADTAVTINSPNGSYVRDKEIAQAVAGYLQKVGVNAQVQVQENTVASQKVRNSQYDMPFIMGLGSRFNGPDDLTDLMTPGFEGFEWMTATQNGPEAKKLYEQAMQTFDLPQQQQMVFKICQLFYEEAPWLFLWDQVPIFGVSRRIDWEASGNSRIDFWLAGDKPVNYVS